MAEISLGVGSLQSYPGPANGKQNGMECYGTYHCRRVIVQGKLFFSKPEPKSINNNDSDTEVVTKKGAHQLVEPSEMLRC